MSKANNAIVSLVAFYSEELTRAAAEQEQLKQVLAARMRGHDETIHFLHLHNLAVDLRTFIDRWRETPGMGIGADDELMNRIADTFDVVESKLNAAMGRVGSPGNPERSG